MTVVHIVFTFIETLVFWVFALGLWRSGKYRLLGGLEDLASLGALTLGIQRLSTLQGNMMLSDALLALPVAILAVLAWSLPKAAETQKRACILDANGQRACHLAMLAEATGNEADIKLFREAVARSRSARAQAVKKRGMTGDA